MTEFHPYEDRDDELPLFDAVKRTSANNVPVPEFTDDDKQRRETVTDRVLEELQDGPKLSSEIKWTTTHRFSGAVHLLRQKGHKILGEKLPRGDWKWTWISYTPTVKVTDEMKSAYYLTEHWRTIRHSRLEIDNYRCCWCGTADAVQVHHWRYDLFNESLLDLMTLCEPCHTKIHEYDTVRTHFPHYVRAEVAEQLAATTYTD